jgi:hypothetical protein
VNLTQLPGNRSDLVKVVFALITGDAVTVDAYLEAHTTALEVIARTALSLLGGFLADTIGELCFIAREDVAEVVRLWIDEREGSAA